MKFFMGILLLIATPVFAGGMTGGGGDILRLRFLDGQRLAVSVLEAIDASSFKAAEPEVQTWILDHQQSWTADVRASKHEWVENATQKTCGWTQFQPSPILLSFEACRSSTFDESGAAFILLHESAHHLGVQSEEFSDKIAKAAIDAWRQRTLVAMPLCPDPNNIVASRIMGDWEFDRELAERLGIYQPEFEGLKFSHYQDDSVAQFFPGLGKCAFVAGWWEADVPALEGYPAYHFKAPFVLVDLRGNPAILFDEHDPKEARAGKVPNYEVVEDVHPGFRMIARGVSQEKDILFMGGDNNNQPLYPFKRATTR